MTSSPHRHRLEQAAAGAAMLYGAGARRVWLFGSLARGGASDRCTDIDFAVEGLGAEVLRALTLRLRAQLRCRLDAVSIEAASPQLRRGIFAHRILLPPDAGGGPKLPALPAADREPRLSLHRQRHEAVLETLLQHRARSVLDLGCGAGLLLERLAAVPEFDRVLGVEMSRAALEAARQRLGSDDRGRVRLIHGLATNPDPRFLGYDAVTAVEVIEHLDPPRLAAFQRVVFSFLRPPLVVLTTPKAEYNVRWQSAPTTALRHRDHRFEWTDAQFREWVERVAGAAGYSCELRSIGASHPVAGQPTQMAVCLRRSLHPNLGEPARRRFTSPR